MVLIKLVLEITGGVDLVGFYLAGFGGPGRDGMTGYAYASPTGSLSILMVTLTDLLQRL